MAGDASGGLASFGGNCEKLDSQSVSSAAEFTREELLRCIAPQWQFKVGSGKNGRHTEHNRIKKAHPLFSI
jgi:hypothetical protein